MGIGMLGLLIGWWASNLSVILAVIGLVRRETPNGPAIIGLSLSLAPAVFGFYIFVVAR